jgi:hypothetical protein
MSAGAAAACGICELERILKDRSRGLRDVLRKMNPTTDPRYDRLFDELVTVDRDLRMLKGRVRER